MRLSYYPCSSTVEPAAVNRSNGGSNPSVGVASRGGRAGEEVSRRRNAKIFSTGLLFNCSPAPAQLRSRRLMVRMSGFQPENAGFNSHREYFAARESRG